MNATIASAVVSIACLSTPIPAQTRLVASVGTIKYIPDAGEEPNLNTMYRTVFDVQNMADSSDEISPAFEMVGALVDTYRGYGVPASNLQMTAVFHGRSILLVTRSNVYAKTDWSSGKPEPGYAA